MSATSAENRTVAVFAQSADDVLSTLGTDARGLSSDEAARRLAEYGPNKLPEPPSRPAILRFLAHFDDVLIYILLVAALLKALLGDWVDFAIILAVAVANAVVSFVQEGRAASALAGIATLLSLDAQTRRDDHWRHLAAEDLVPGDVVRVRSGDKVPADLRLIEATGLHVDESALTGESVPATKDVAPVATDAGVGDRTSMLFSGTIVASGRGLGVVTATGADTEIGRIQTLVSEVDPLDTPLTRQLAHLGKQLAWAILGMALVMLVVGRVVHHFAVDELISAAIGFAVAAVPEGLPALVTITLALGVQQMARRNAITRTLPSVEGLGSVTTVCSDKTGTLTKNEMTARSVVTAVGHYDVEGIGYAPVGAVLADGLPVDLAEHDDLAALLRTARACNDARVVEEAGAWRVVGQPTEGALTALAQKAGISLAGVTRLAQVPFESENKFSATLDDVEGEHWVHVVGAPDRLLDRCADGLDRGRWEAEIDRLGRQGLRVLAAARRPGGSLTTLGVDDVTDLDFLGLVGIVDPPRPEVTAAIAQCHRAGIAVKMITGDHAGTATAIARELGIVTTEDVTVLTGTDLEAMSNERLRQVVQQVDVYARTSPEHKIRIVRALQACGEVVAMTGDGVNDAPALTRADVGVAMGIKGTEATKEAADIVLADDNFATIERAVEEGRRIYDNIRKSVVFLLPTNGAQSLVILVAVLLGLQLPLTPVQILWVNLVTAVTLSLSLSGEPAEPGLMDRPPRSPKAHVLTRQGLWVIAAASLLIGAATFVAYILEDRGGVGHGRAQTTAVCVLAAGQMAYLFSCRFLARSSLTWSVLRGNRLVWVACAALAALQLVFVYAPFMHAWFGSVPITAKDWAMVLAAAVLVFLGAEAAKAAVRRWAPA